MIGVHSWIVLPPKRTLYPTTKIAIVTVAIEIYRSHSATFSSSDFAFSIPPAARTESGKINVTKNKAIKR